jgi:transcriptional regulator GlxA family with amidase domain
VPEAISRRIVVTAYDGISLLDLAGPLEAFRVASTFGGPSPSGRLATYECSVVSVRGGPVKTANGVVLVTDSVRTLSRTQIDTLIVPGAFLVDDVTRDRDLVQWVRKKAPTCRRVCSVCVGSFLLAAAGVLDGRRAATHWMHAPLLATRHPQVAVEPDAIFVHDGRVWSSAGVTTGIDLALALIEEDAGRQVAMNVARMLVVYLKRSGGQSQYSALLAAQAESDSDSFSELERWIVEHLKSDLSVDALANRVHMSPRNFARVYAAKRGRTPAKMVEAIRVDAARRRIEETDDRIDSVAERCGFSSEEQMRCAFLRTLSIPPRDYRKRFSSTAMS